jgi:inner membrane protein
VKWISHIAIAGALAAVFNPVAVPAAILGGTAPDWFEFIKRAANPEKKVKHRGSTHYLVGWVAAMAMAHFLWDWNGWGFWFAAGGAVHWFADALTMSGAPVGPWSDRRVTLFGGKVATGSAPEYAITIVICTACAVAIYARGGLQSAAFSPFFYDWRGMQEDGFLDPKELRANRFNII